MQFYRKTRRGWSGLIIRPLIKVAIFSLILLIVILFVGNMNLPAPNKFIKQKIPNEKFKVIK